MISAYRHQISIQGPVKTPNGKGGWKTEYQNIETGIWASINPVNERERLEWQKLDLVVTHQISMPPRPWIIEEIRQQLKECRIIFGTRIFKIISFRDPGERGRRLDFVCAEYIPAPEHGSVGSGSGS